MSRQSGAALVAGCMATALLVWTARVPEAGAGWRIAFVALHLVAFGGLVLWLPRLELSVREVLLGAVLFRLIALPLAPTLSDDGYRYVWDGLVTVEGGVSPYAYRPSDPKLAQWQDTEMYREMNSPDYYSVYPPGSQFVFALAASAYRTFGWAEAWWIWKLIMVAAELSAIVLLLRAVPPSRAALYAWSPLAVIEVAGQGHTEALVLVGLAALLTTARGRVPWRSLGVAWAGAVKLYPLALLPQAWRRDGWPGVAASVGLLGVLSIPLWSPMARSHLGESLALFFGTFDEYAAPYRVLKAALYPVAADAAGRVASGLLAVGFAGAALWAVLADDGTWRALSASLVAVVVGFAVTAATLHPWYWVSVLYVVPLLQNNQSVSWLTALATASYLAYVLPQAEIPVLVVGWGGAAAIWWIRRTSGATAQPDLEPAPGSRCARPARSHRDSGGTT